MIRHLGAEIGVLSFQRNWWKYVRPPIILTSAYILACQAGTSGRYSTGGTPPIKAEQVGQDSHLVSAWRRGNTSTRIWTRALQPVQEEVSSWRFHRAQTVSGPLTFSRSADISPGAEISTPTKILSFAYISANSEAIPFRRKPLRRTRLLHHPAQTQVWSEQVWLNTTTFISQGSQSWDKLAIEA